MMTRTSIFLLLILFYGCSSNGQTKKDQQIEKLITLAITSDSLKDYQTSIKHYSEILALEPKKLFAINNRGGAYFRLGEFEKGFADRDKAIMLYPNEGTYYRRGLAYIIVKNYDRAASDFLKSIELNPQFGESYYGLALVKVSQDSLDLALQLCEKADKLSYQQELSREVRVTVLQKKGDLKAVVNQLSEAIKLDPANPTHYNNRGLVKNQLKQFADALPDFDYAIKLDSKMAFAYNNKAFSLLKLKRFDNALEAVNASLNLNNKNAYAYKNRAEIFIALNSKQKACMDLIEAEKLSNDKELTKEIKQLLDKECKE
jgi:tetratricopeptide (TPR) repeat protein